MVLVPQSIAATGVTGPTARPSATHGPAAHHSPSSVEHLVAERVDAAALGERLAGEHVQALDPVGHAARGDAVDLRDVAELGPGRQVALVGGGVRRRQLGVVGAAAPPSPSSGPEPSSVPIREAARGQVR